MVKADGLAAGKGVYICETLESSTSAVEEIFNGKFGVAKEVLIEEFLEGEEMSFFVISMENFKKIGAQIIKEFWRVIEVKIQVEWVPILPLDLKMTCLIKKY